MKEKMSDSALGFNDRDDDVESLSSLRSGVPNLRRWFVIEDSDVDEANDMQGDYRGGGLSGGSSSSSSSSSLSYNDAGYGGQPSTRRPC